MNRGKNAVRRARRGAAMLFVLVLASILMLFAGAMLRSTLLARQAALAEENELQTLWLLESAKSRSVWESSQTEPAEWTAPAQLFGEDRVSIQVDEESEDETAPRRIRVVVTYGSRGTRRALSETIEISR